MTQPFDYQATKQAHADEIAAFRNGSYEERTAWLEKEAGHETHGNPVDWYKINVVMNEAMDLGQDAHTVAAITLTDEALGTVVRFRDSQHLTKVFGDSTAAHQKQCQIEMRDVFERTGMLEAERELYVNSMIAIGTHDVGEVPGEASTVAGRAREGFHSDLGNVEVANKDDVEHDITRFCLKLADKALSQGNPQLFRDVIADVTEKAEIEELGMYGLSRIPALLEGHEKQLGIGADYALPPSLQNAFDCYLDVETPDTQSFMRTIVKNIESMQGNQHYAKQAGKGMTVPISAGTSNSIIAGLNRGEKGLPEMFSMAKTANEETIAREVCARSYDNLIDILDKSPGILDRKANNTTEPDEKERNSAIDSAKATYQSRLPKVREGLKSVAEQGGAENRFQSRMEIETALRMKTLYQAAKKGVLDGRFTPEGALIKSESMPDSLRPLIEEVRAENKEARGAAMGR